MTGDKVRQQELDETRQKRDVARYVFGESLARLRRLETLTLILTVLTTGSLWATLTKQFPEPILWIGALLSTGSALVTGWVKQRNYSQVAIEAGTLQTKLTDLLIKYTKSPEMPREEYRVEHKKLEDECDKLERKTGIRAPR